MDIVLGVSMAPTAVRLSLIEGENADGATLEQDTVEVAEGQDSTPFEAAADQVIAAVTGTREGAVESGCRLVSAGVTWTDPAGVARLRSALAGRDLGGVMLVSPLLAASALAQTVGDSLGYSHIAMLFVEPTSATLAIIDVVDGSIKRLQRQPLGEDGVADELAGMVGGLGTRGPQPDGIVLIGCGTDIGPIKPLLEAAVDLDVSAHDPPDMALAHGAALASANAPLFNASTAALAYALDPGTGEMSPTALAPSYLDISAADEFDETVRAYSAISDDLDFEKPARDRRPMLIGSGVAAGVVIGALVVSLAFSRLLSASHRAPEPPPQVAPQPAAQMPVPSARAALPAPSAPPAAPPPAAPPSVQAAPAAPAPEAEPPRSAPVYRAPVQRAAPAPVQQAPVAPPPVAAPPPAPPPEAPPPPAQPVPTMYLHLPFVTVPIPLNPPPPPAPPPPAP